MPEVSHFDKQPFVSKKITEKANRVVDEVNRLQRLIDSRPPDSGQVEETQLYERPWLGKIVDAGPNAEDDFDVDDCRYWVQRCYVQAQGTDGMDDKLDVNTFDSPDEESEETWPVIHTVSNLAEKNGATETHLLSVGAFVLVSIEESFASPQNIHYIMRHTPQVSVVVRIDGNASGGKYNGKVFIGTSSATATGDLSMPEGMTDGEDALILHTPEDGKPTHWLETGTYATGVVVGRTTEDPSRWIVAIGNGTYRQDSPDALTGSGATADTKSWDRDAVAAGDVYGDNPIQVTFYRVAWDSGTNSLKQYGRTLTYDAGGNLVSATAETEETIDTAEDCTGE